MYLMAYILNKYLHIQYSRHCLLLSFTWPKFFHVLFHKCMIYNCLLHGPGPCHCHILVSCSSLPCRAYPSSVVSEREQGSGILSLVRVLETGTDLGKQRKEKNRKIFFLHSQKPFHNCAVARSDAKENFEKCSWESQRKWSHSFWVAAHS